ncbi:NAD(P)H-binding protein [Actinomadura sp. DC4]|uniref:NAD(P)H-binding protein n=1 Tax=Actinomadura sp. DC4 TaxID=3055069 RepID=UPI0025AF08B0|nr:NAD(P)H-binding protein [Actinomadura sp. DC4]MDN3354513.1 NAD(P)H-binding protein [Actinomadura sp. DC4]
MTNVILAATGNVGRQIVAQLAGHAAVRAVTRDPAALPGSVYGDLSAPDTIAACVEEGDAVFLLWPLHTGRLLPAVVDAIARRAGRVVFLGTGGVPDLGFEEQEKLIHGCGIASTVLRPSTFAVNTLWWTGQIRTGDVVRGAYGALPMALIHEADMAAVAVRALTEPGHDDATYELTGPEILTQAEQVRVIGEVLDRPLRWEGLTREQARLRLLADETFPDSFVDVLLDGYAAMLAGPPPTLTSTVQDVTGTPPRSLREWVADHAADFVCPGP